jgi:hypothetical protein
VLYHTGTTGASFYYTLFTAARSQAAKNAILRGLDNFVNNFNFKAAILVRFAGLYRLKWPSLGP